MKIATWNVNGIRAREDQLLEWVAKEKPDVFCLQEIKAQITQLPLAWGVLAGYESFFHGSGGYSGVSLHVKKSLAPARVAFSHPPFDFETRVVEGRFVAADQEWSVASVYVPNGGKDYPAKIAFLKAMIAWAEGELAAGRRLLICGDLNVAHREVDVHPTERKPRAVGQKPEERKLFDALLALGLVDVARKLHGEGAFYTWWPYWRQARENNVGWRIDYVLATRDVAEHATSCVSQREFGASDHAPLVVELDFSA